MGRIPTVYFCPYENCTASFTRLHKYDCHQRMHSGERPFVCQFDGCEKSFIRPSHLKRHEETHEAKFSRCSVEGCSEILKTKATLKKHMDYVHGKKKHKMYKCTLCDKEFNKHNWLQRHMFRHTGKPPHICPVEDCGKEFLLPSRLKRHMKYHRGYACKKDNCDQVFPKWSFLVKHMKESHPAVHKCDSCDKVFSSTSNLKMHRLVHQEKPEAYMCDVPYCSRYFFHKRYLKAHMKCYHEKRPFVCSKEYCHRAFKTEELLADHVLYHDSKKPRHKKKRKPKPTMAAILAGCVPPKIINRKPASVPDASEPSEKCDSSLPKEEDVQLLNEDNNVSDYVMITVTVSSGAEDVYCEEKDDSKSCLAILEDILNGSTEQES